MKQSSCLYRERVVATALALGWAAMLQPVAIVRVPPLAAVPEAPAQGSLPARGARELQGGEGQSYVITMREEQGARIRAGRADFAQRCADSAQRCAPTLLYVASLF